MNFEREVNFITKTNGRGLWSNVIKTVQINRIILTDVTDDNNFGELRAYFETKDWDLYKDGLIYTDPGWIVSFTRCMATLGFSIQAITDIDYSEQGMQGETYVSMDVGPDFIAQCSPLFRFVVNKEAVNNYG